MYRALLEGGACAMRSIFDQVSEWCGPPRRLRFTGSGARSAVWRQMIVDLVGRPAETVGGGEEARGAAIYAAIAIGEQSDLDSACAAMVRVEEVVEPRPEVAAAYAELYADWRRADRVMRSLDGVTGVRA
jgi:sugar (pentulose or hexulose) kinase